MTFDIAGLLIGTSAPMRQLRATIQRVAPTPIPVLIEGETGTGKELVATALFHGSRQRGAFVPINVCAVGEALFESALFGHVRGAFTGAVADAAGFLSEAHTGTLFLDEISGLGITLQAKLLRAIETKQFRPVGGRTDRRSDFRVIAASNEDLRAAVAEGRFRLDLLQRLGAVRLRVPPLRERREDILLLVSHFAQPRSGFSRSPKMDQSALRVLQEHPWPGNVRELRHVVEAATALCGDDSVTAADLVPLLNHGEPRLQHRPVADGHLLIAALEECAWDVNAAAARLGVHRATVYRRMKRLTKRGGRAAMVTEEGVPKPRDAADRYVSASAPRPPESHQPTQRAEPWHESTPAVAATVERRIG